MIRSRLGVLVVLTVQVFAATLTAKAAEPVFRVVKLDGTTSTGRLVNLGAETVTLAAVDSEDKSDLKLADLYKLTREDVAPPYPPREMPLILFGGGDRLTAAIDGSDDSTFRVRSDALGELAIPLDRVSAIVFRPPGGQTDPAATLALLDRIAADPAGSESLFLLNGDRQRGAFLGFDARGRKVSFQLEGGKTEIDRNGIAALALDKALIQDPPPEGLYLDWTLTDGSRIGVTGAHWVDGQIEAVPRFGGKAVRVPIGELAAIHVRQERVRDLTETAPTGSQTVSYFGPTRPLRRGSSVDGGALTLGGRTYDRGLGMTSRTLLLYPLEPGDKRFQALIGVDDRAGPLGNVVFRVLVDGEERFASPPMVARDEPKSIDVDLAGGSRLILIVEFGARGNVRDLADWVEARIVR